MSNFLKKKANIEFFWHNNLRNKAFFFKPVEGGRVEGLGPGSGDHLCVIDDLQVLPLLKAEILISPRIIVVEGDEDL